MRAILAWWTATALPILSCSIVFVGALYHPADSDLGWHLQYAQHFFRTGKILETNAFSTEMPGFAWTNHSWGADLITGIIYGAGGMRGLSYTGALTMTAAWLFFARAANLSSVGIAIFSVPITIVLFPFTEVSFRSQQLSLLFLGILLLILSRYKQHKRLIWLTIPLFILWANIHGAYLMGLGTFAVWIVGRGGFAIRSAEIISIFFLSFLATLMNPWGPGIYRETINHFRNPVLQYIIEWTPMERYSSMRWTLAGWGLLLSVSIGYLILTKRIRQTASWTLPAVLLFVLAWMSRRYAWPMYLVSLPVIAPLTAAIERRLGKYAVFIASVVIIGSYAWMLMEVIPARNLSAMGWHSYCRRLHCSPESAHYLTEHPAAGKLLTFYTWGGWLIHQYPAVKPSVDGRMTLWRDETGYSAFAEYFAYEQNIKDIDRSDYDTVYMPPDKPITTRLEQLVKEGKWQLLYQDPYARVYIRTRYEPHINPR